MGFFCFLGYSYREDYSPLAFHGVLCKLNSSLKYFFSQKDRKSYLQCILLLLWTLFHICAKLKTLRDLIVQMTFVMGLGLAVVVGLGLLFGSGIFTKDKSVRHFIIVAIPVIPSFWQNETLHIQYFSIADVVIYHGSQLKFCHAPLSLSQLPSRLMSWRLFSMV